MRRLIFLFIPVFVFSLSACTNWPEQGHGGMAEHHQVMFNEIMPDQPLGPEHGLRFELDLGRHHLDILILNGAELCFPASVNDAKLRQDRITRELHGGLDFDAANDLIIQRRFLERLERQLDAVKQQEVCTPPTTINLQTPVNVSLRLDELLNIDNQFAFDSAELNPKYIVHLAEAALLLSENPEYTLHITGHADAIGDKEHNRKLSLQRAKKVSQFLQAIGLKAERIEIDAAGSLKPLFDGKEPHNRLVNRRVSIVLTKVSDSTLTTN